MNFTYKIWHIYDIYTPKTHFCLRKTQGSAVFEFVSKYTWKHPYMRNIQLVCDRMYFPDFQSDTLTRCNFNPSMDN